MKRRALLLVGLTLGLAYAAHYVAKTRAPAQEVASTLLYPGLLAQINDVQKIDITQGQEHLTVQRLDAGWVMPSRDNFVVNTAAVKELLVQLASLKIREAKTATPALYATLGVEAPDAPKATTRAVVLSAKGDAPLADLLIGKARKAQRVDAPAHYVRRQGEPTAWLVEGELLLKAKRNEWLDTSVVDIPVERVRKVSLQQPGKTPVVLAKASLQEQLFTLQKIPKGSEPRSVAMVSSMGALLLDLRFDDVAAASKVTGLSPQSSAEIATFDGLVATLKRYVVNGQSLIAFSFAQQTGVTPATPPPANDKNLPPGSVLPAPAQSAPVADVAAEVALLNARTQHWVYQLPDYKSHALAKTLEDLIKPKGPQPTTSMPE